MVVPAPFPIHPSAPLRAFLPPSLPPFYTPDDHQLLGGSVSGAALLSSNSTYGERATHAYTQLCRLPPINDVWFNLTHVELVEATLFLLFQKLLYFEHLLQRHL